MKWGDYCETLGNNPRLAPCILHYVEGENADKCRVFIEKSLEYIAFRPFDHLELNRSSWCEEDHQAMEPTIGKVCFTVFFHVEGTERGPYELPCCRYVDVAYGGDEGDADSVAEAIDFIRSWYAQLDDSGYSKLCFDAVVRYEEARGMIGINVYPFPEYPQFKPWGTMTNQEAISAIKKIAGMCWSVKELNRQLNAQIPGYCSAERAVCYHEGAFSIMVHGPEGGSIQFITP